MLSEERVPQEILSPKFLSAITALLLLLFIYLTGLLQRPVSYDEAVTSLRISGYSEANLVQDLSEEIRPVTVDYLSKYTNYNFDNSTLDMLDGLVKEEPQLAPFYYITARFWARLLGSSIPIVRLGSLCLIVLSVLVVYQLTFELFSSRMVATFTAIIFASSPFTLVYSLDARHYSFWSLSVLLSSLLFLHATRSNTNKAWFFYALGSALSFYVNLLSVLVTLGHFLCLIILDRFRLTSRVKKGWVSSLGSFIAFIPWVGVIFYNLSAFQNATGSEEIGSKVPLGDLARGWLRIPGNFLYRVNNIVDYESPSSIEKFVQYASTLVSLIIVVYSLYFLFRKSSSIARIFVATLISSTWMILVFQDLTIGAHSASGGMSNREQYLFPCFLVVIIAIAYLLFQKISNSVGYKRRAEVWRVTALMLFITQLVASISIVGVNASNTQSYKDVEAMFEVINDLDKSLFIAEMSGWDILYYTHFLEPNEEVLIEPFCYFCNIDTNVSAFPGSLDLDLAQYDFILLANALTSSVEQSMIPDWLSALTHNSIDVQVDEDASTRLLTVLRVST